MARWGLPCAATLLTMGCATYGSHLTASPLPPGDGQLALTADALVIDRGLGPQVVPNPEVGLRRGLLDDLDIGGRVNVGGLEGNVRWRIAGSDRIDLALVPGLGFGFVPVTNADTGLFNASGLASLLFGVETSPRAELVLGARAVATYAFPATAFLGDASGAKMLYLPGATLGFRLPVGESTYLFPDASVLLPYDSESREWYFPTIQGGLSLQLE